MTLPQAVGVIFGANIGTTFTSVLISLDIGSYAMPIMFVGSALIFFFKKKKVNYSGQALLGFGMLFFGLETMGGALKLITHLQGFTEMINSVTNTPFLGVLVGILTTSIVQSSSATIGILQQLFSTGAVPIIGAIAIVLGDNIGTTLTSVLASIGGSRQAKRAALIHVTFNLVNVFILYWFIKQLIWLVYKIIPSKNEVEVDEIILDKTLLKESPELALENVKSAITNMSNVAKAMYEYAFNCAFKYDLKDQEMGAQCEEVIDTMDNKIHNYLVAISANDLTEVQSQMVAKDIDTISDIERIGDHMDNLFEFFEVRSEKKNDFPRKNKRRARKSFHYS